MIKLEKEGQEKSVLIDLGFGQILCLKIFRNLFVLAFLLYFSTTHLFVSLCVIVDVSVVWIQELHGTFRRRHRKR